MTEKQDMIIRFKNEEVRNSEYLISIVKESIRSRIKSLYKLGFKYEHWHKKLNRFFDRWNLGELSLEEKVNKFLSEF